MKPKEFIKELYDKRNGITGDQLKCLIERKFPELVKKDKHFKNGDIVVFIGQCSNHASILVKITDVDEGSCYGFNRGKFGKFNHYSFKNRPSDWEKVYESVWRDRLIEECKKRDIWDTKYFNPVQGPINIIPRSIVYNEASDILWSIHGTVYHQGVFATPIETITKEEAEKQLGKKIV